MCSILEGVYGEQLKLWFTRCGFWGLIIRAAQLCLGLLSPCFVVLDCCCQTLVRMLTHPSFYLLNNHFFAFIIFLTKVRDWNRLLDCLHSIQILNLCSSAISCAGEGAHSLSSLVPIGRGRYSHLPSSFWLRLYSFAAASSRRLTHCNFLALLIYREDFQIWFRTGKLRVNWRLICSNCKDLLLNLILVSQIDLGRASPLRWNSV